MWFAEDLIPKKEIMQDFIANEEMLQDFHCNVCKCLLTVPPIRLVENQYVCGRCPGDGRQDMSLERFASRFKYPCRYVQKGCALNIIWAEVDKHEITCGYRSSNCPITNCEWEGTKAALVQHFQDTHDSKFLSEKDSIKLSDIQVAKYFYFIGGDAGFEVVIENSKETITYKITVLWSKEDSSFYQCKFTLHNSDLNLSLFHEAKTLGVASEVNKNTIKSLTDNSDEMQLQIKIDVHDKMNRYVVECNKCSSPMTKNIYMAKCGHSICQSCFNHNLNERINKCEKNCNNYFSPTYKRNLTLEKFMASLQFN